MRSDDVWGWIEIVEEGGVDGERGVGRGVGDKRVVESVGDGGGFGVVWEFDLLGFEDSVWGIGRLDGGMEIVGMVENGERELWFVGVMDRFGEVVVIRGRCVVGMGVVKWN